MKLSPHHKNKYSSCDRKQDNILKTVCSKSVEGIIALLLTGAHVDQSRSPSVVGYTCREITSWGWKSNSSLYVCALCLSRFCRNSHNFVLFRFTIFDRCLVSQLDFYSITRLSIDGVKRQTERAPYVWNGNAPAARLTEEQICSASGALFCPQVAVMRGGASPVISVTCSAVGPVGLGSQSQIHTRTFKTLIHHWLNFHLHSQDVFFDVGLFAVVRAPGGDSPQSPPSALLQYFLRFWPPGS